MFLTIAHFFNVLAFLDLTLAILCCILIVKLPIKYGIKFVSIPLIVLSTYVLIIQGEDVLGRPYDTTPVGEFEFLDYRVVVKDGQKRIELWVVQDKKSRLHIIDHTAKRESEMAKAKSRRNKGSREKGVFGIPGKDGKGVERDLSIADVPTEKIFPPKEGDEKPEPTLPPVVPEDDATKSWQNRT